MASCDHQLKVIEEINRAKDVVTQLQALLLPSLPSSNRSVLARDLFEGTLRSLTAAQFELRPIASAYHSHGAEKIKGIEKKRKITQKQVQSSSRKRSKGSNSWTTVTMVPHVDGHQWRKYGQKQIRNGQFLRNYYGCTYFGDQGCPARKTIQQMDNDNNEYPPKFVVSYIERHNCKCLEPSLVPVNMASSATSPVSRMASKPFPSVTNPFVDYHSPNSDSSAESELMALLSSSEAELGNASTTGGNWEAMFHLTNQFDTWDEGEEWWTTSNECVWGSPESCISTGTFRDY